MAQLCLYIRIKGQMVWNVPASQQCAEDAKRLRERPEMPNNRRGELWVRGMIGKFFVVVAVVCCL